MWEVMASKRFCCSWKSSITMRSSSFSLFSRLKWSFSNLKASPACSSTGSTERAPRLAERDPLESPESLADTIARLSSDSPRDFLRFLEDKGPEEESRRLVLMEDGEAEVVEVEDVFFSFLTLMSMAEDEEAMRAGEAEDDDDDDDDV